MMATALSSHLNFSNFAGEVHKEYARRRLFVPKMLLPLPTISFDKFRLKENHSAGHTAASCARGARARIDGLQLFV
jgi:hypothetical protein